MNKLTKKFPFPLILISYFSASLFVFRKILFLKGTIGLRDDWSLPPLVSQNIFLTKRILYSWTSEFLGISVLRNSGDYLGVLLGILASVFRFDGEVFSKSLPIIFITLSGFFFYKFSREFAINIWASFISSFIYMFSPVVFNSVVSGYIIFLISYTFFPLFLIFFKKVIDRKELNLTHLILATITLRIVFSQDNFIFISLIVVISYFLFYDIVLWKRWKKIFIDGLKIFTIYTFSLLLMGPFIVNIISGFSKNLDIIRKGAVSWNTFIAPPLSKGFFLDGAGYQYFFESVPGNFYPAWLFFSTILLISIFSAFFFVRQNKHILYFGGLVLFSLFIFKGNNPPFSQINAFLIRNLFVFMAAFRNIQYITVISSLGYAILFGFFLNYFISGIIKKRKTKTLVLAILMFSLILSIYPFLTGDFGGNIQTYKLDDFYIKLDNDLRVDNEDYRVLWLPPSQPMSYKNSKFAGLDPLFFGQPKAPVGNDGLSEIEQTLTKNLYTGEDISSLKAFMAFINIKKIIYRNDFNSRHLDFMGTEFMWLRPIWNNASLLESIGKMSNIIKEKNYGHSIEVFKNDYFLPHFYIPQNVIYSDGDVEGLPDIVSFWDYEIRSGIYIDENRELKKKEGSLLNRADEIFAEAELAEMFTGDYLEKKGSFRDEVAFPYTRHRPGSFLYRLVLKKEQLDEWLVRNNKEKLIEKKLFYASKRISEIEKWRREMDLDKAFERYETKMEEVIKILKEGKWDDEKEKSQNALKFQTFLDAHRQKIMDLGLSEKGLVEIKKISDELKEETEDSKIKYDFTKRLYSFEIPKEGNYQLLIKNEEFGRYLRDTQLELEMLGERTIVPLPSEDEKWISSGSFKLEKGEKELSLTKPSTINLLDVDDWQDNLTESIFVKNKLISATHLQLAFPKGSTAYFKPVTNYQGGSLYRVTFDYFVSGGEAGIILIEDVGIRIRELRFWEKLRATGTDSPRHFEKFFKSTSGTKTAEFYFWGKTEGDNESQIKLFNVKIERVFEPTIILRSINYQSPITNHQLPRITFIKINPTKYRIKVERAKEPYTLIFSESFNEGWKAYISNQQSATSDQQYGETVASYFDGEIKEGTHKNIFLDGNTFETWGKESIPEDRHYLVNGYANSWYITPEDADGQENYEIIIEFWPQRIFYLGLGISLLTLLGCLSYLGSSFVKKKTKG